MMTEKEKFLHSVLWHHSAVKQASQQTENQTWLPAGGTPVKVTVQSKETRRIEGGKEGGRGKKGCTSKEDQLFPLQIESSEGKGWGKKREWQPQNYTAYVCSTDWICWSCFHMRTTFFVEVFILVQDFHIYVTTTIIHVFYSDFTR